MKRFGLTLLAGFAAALVFAQALPGPSNGRISRAGGGKPGGSAPQLQYNNGGVFGGVAHVTSDGTHDIYTAEALPAAPTSGSTAFDLNTLPFPAPMRIDSFFGLPTPNGFFRGQPGISQMGTVANWYSCFNYCTQWNSTGFDMSVGCLVGTAQIEGSGASGGGWSGASFTGRIRRVGVTTSAGQNWVGMHRGNLDDGEWTGNAPGVGGFVMWARFWGVTHQANDETFAGVAATASAFPNGSRPGQQLNSAYVGCDASDTNLSVCSNDGAATSCNADLGSSFPCRTNGVIYDVWLAYPPNSALPDGGTGFAYYVERLDSPATASGTKSGNLPSAVQLTPHVVLHNTDAGALTEKIEISGVGTWALW